MRNRLFLSLVAAASLFAASTVQAGTLTSATWLQVTQGIPLTRTTMQLSASGTSTGTTASVSINFPLTSINVFVPKTSMGVLDLGIKVTQGGATVQKITAAASMASGNPGIGGTVVVMTASHIAMGANQSMFMNGATTLVAVPLSNGKAGQFTSTFSVLGNAHQITVDFFAWTPHTVMFAGLTSKGAALPNVTAKGSFALNGAGAGQVTLVSPSKVSINGTLAQRRTAAFTTLVLKFAGVPEPGTLLLLCAGALGLVVIGSRSKS